MSRPRKFRNVCSLPQVTRFGPLGQAHGREVFNMTVDEYETIRLIDYDGLTQEECAKQMNVARTTVQAMYAEARKKIARSLVDGKIIVIEGGDYKLCSAEDNFCGRGCQRQRMHRGRFHGARFNNNMNQED